MRVAKKPFIKSKDRLVLSRKIQEKVKAPTNDFDELVHEQDTSSLSGIFTECKERKYGKEGQDGKDVDNSPGINLRTPPGWDFKADDSDVWWCMESNSMPSSDEHDRLLNGAISASIIEHIQGTPRSVSPTLMAQKK